jgi:hypothetical protein
MLLRLDIWSLDGNRGLLHSGRYKSMILGKPWLRAVKAKADHYTEKYTILSAEGRAHELIKNGPTWESAPTIFRDANLIILNRLCGRGPKKKMQSGWKCVSSTTTLSCGKPHWQRIYDRTSGSGRLLEPRRR